MDGIFREISIRITLQAEDYFDRISEWSLLLVIENPNEKIGSRELAELEFTPRQLKEFFHYAVEYDIIKHSYKDMDLGNMLRKSIRNFI